MPEAVVDYRLRLRAQGIPTEGLCQGRLRSDPGTVWNLTHPT